MWKTFYIQPNEIGILYYRSDFKKILSPGTYTYFGRYWQVITYDLNQPEAKIENLDLLLRTHAIELQEHLLIVRTAFNTAALTLRSKLGKRRTKSTPRFLAWFY